MTKDLIIEGNKIETAHDLYSLYNDYLCDITDADKAPGRKYDPYKEPAYTIERIRDFYKEVFEKIPRKEYKSCEDFERKCKKMDLIPAFYTIPIG